MPAVGGFGVPDRQKVMEELNFLTDVLSNRVRTIAGGVLAFCWAFVVEGSQNPTGAGLVSVWEVITPIGLALFALTFDLSQYMFGYSLNRRMLRELALKKQDSVPYRTDALAYRARGWSFNLKLVCALVAVLWLIGLLGVKMASLL
jgi:hypothetical protein